MDKYAYYVVDEEKIAIVKWNYSKGRWETPDKTVTGGFYSYYTPIWDLQSITPEKTLSTQMNIPAKLWMCVVYYIKSRMHEEMLDLETAEYFRRKYRQQAVRFQNSRISGMRRMSVGRHAIR